MQTFNSFQDLATSNALQWTPIATGEKWGRAMDGRHFLTEETIVYDEETKMVYGSISRNINYDGDGQPIIDEKRGQLGDNTKWSTRAIPDGVKYSKFGIEQPNEKHGTAATLERGKKLVEAKLKK